VQGYDRALVPLVVRLVPAVQGLVPHLLELLAVRDTSASLFAITLTAHVAAAYPGPALQVCRALTRGSNVQSHAMGMLTCS
jgi:hypothetical protein